MAYSRLLSKDEGPGAQEDPGTRGPRDRGPRDQGIKGPEDQGNLKLFFQ